MFNKIKYFDKEIFSKLSLDLDSMIRFNDSCTIMPHTDQTWIPNRRSSMETELALITNNRQLTTNKNIIMTTNQHLYN